MAAGPGFFGFCGALLLPDDLPRRGVLVRRVGVDARVRRGRGPGVEQVNQVQGLKLAAVGGLHEPSQCVAFPSLP